MENKEKIKDNPELKGKYIYIVCRTNSNFAWATPFEKHEDAVAYVNNEIAYISKSMFSRTKQPAKVTTYINRATVESSDKDTTYQYIIYRKKIR